jgi:hypothetical protein
MKGSLAMRCIFLALILIGGSAVSWSADRKGTVEWACCGTSFHLRPLHPSKKKDAPEKEIVLWLEQGCPFRIPIEMMVSSDRSKVQAKLCDLGATQCEKATSAKMRLQLVSKNGKRASGFFIVDFPSAGHEEGKFTVKLRRQVPGYICE